MRCAPASVQVPPLNRRPTRDIDFEFHPLMEAFVASALPRCTTPPTSALRAPLSTLRLFRLLLWVQWPHLRRPLARGLAEIAVDDRSPWSWSASSSGICALGYWLFFKGLNFLYRFPLVGSLLSQLASSISYFGFFFIMLVFSNLIIGKLLHALQEPGDDLAALPCRWLRAIFTAGSFSGSTRRLEVGRCSF